MPTEFGNGFNNTLQPYQADHCGLGAIHRKRMELNYRNLLDRRTRGFAIKVVLIATDYVVPARLCQPDLLSLLATPTSSADVRGDTAASKDAQEETRWVGTAELGDESLQLLRQALRFLTALLVGHSQAVSPTPSQLPSLLTVVFAHLDAAHKIWLLIG